MGHFVAGERGEREGKGKEGITFPVMALLGRYEFMMGSIYRKGKLLLCRKQRGSERR